METELAELAEESHGCFRYFKGELLAVGRVTRVHNHHHAYIPVARDYSSSEVLVHYMQQVLASSVLISAFRGLLWRLIAAK